MRHRGCRSWYSWSSAVSNVEAYIAVNSAEKSAIGANSPFDKVPDKRSCNCHRDWQSALGSRSVIPGEGAATEHLNPLATWETDRRAGTSVG
jgi:hypothetical protein